MSLLIFEQRTLRARRLKKWVRAGLGGAWRISYPLADSTIPVRMQLHALAYNLANFLRTLATPAEVWRWPRTALS